ncbi:S-adenosylmethionine carrier 1, chloroplastic/mitochondrial-like isoform X4 [Citrus sinensis]|uniref:S-adenosylmethionine carrier 1, chloroplastic/mitochondrial-like isoform X4 n=1 Tax=Citrus sinensis TaxID=2711 RepID=UPI00227927B1|nr:S-adenosylmethionine carrier 1, chloroplastic/mitochondrial-like isoform X4 [Citrus sinensis]
MAMNASSSPTKSSAVISYGFTDELVLKSKLWNGRDEPRVAFASVSAEEDKPFNFLHVLFDCAIAGGTAGVFVEAALYPIDTIKTRLQAAHGGGKINLKGLYSGLVGNLAGVFPASAIFLGIYEPVKQKLLETFPENLSAFAHLTAGAVGGAASSLVRVPTEVIKQRIQTGQFTSAPDAVRLIVRREGLKGLFAARRSLSNAENAIVGAFAGAITGAVTAPLDVIKTRLMVQGSANQYKGICDCVSTIAREEGISTLFKGMGPRVLWIGIGGSIFFGVLEKTKEVLAQRHFNSQDSSSFKLD